MFNSPVIYTLAGIWSLLIIASFIVWLISKLKPGGNYHELILRTKSWWVMLGIFTLAMVTNRIVSLVFLGFISFLALKEYLSLIPTRRADRRTLFWVYMAIPIQFYWAGISWYGMFIIFIPVYMFLFLPFRLLIAEKTEGFLKSVGTIQWGLMICIFCISHTAFLLMLPAKQAVPLGGIGLLLYLVFLNQFNDVAQYFWGKLFGKHKIMPNISPKKTWEGFIGGVVTTTITACIIYKLLTPFSILLAIITGILISVTGFIGDVTISAIKRDIGVKDMSTTIPGHGGILDRVDSLTFAAPLFFHLVFYLYY